MREKWSGERARGCGPAAMGRRGASVCTVLDHAPAAGLIVRHRQVRPVAAVQTRRLAVSQNALRVRGVVVANGAVAEEVGVIARAGVDEGGEGVDAAIRAAELADEGDRSALLQSSITVGNANSEGEFRPQWYIFCISSPTLPWKF